MPQNKQKINFFFWLVISQWIKYENEKKFFFLLSPLCTLARTFGNTVINMRNCIFNLKSFSTVIQRRKYPTNNKVVVISPLRCNNLKFSAKTKKKFFVFKLQMPAYCAESSRVAKSQPLLFMLDTANNRNKTMKQNEKKNGWIWNISLQKQMQKQKRK